MGRYFYLLTVALALFGLNSCITGQSKGDLSGAVGMNEAQLVAQKGQPQKIIDTPDGGKILAYETIHMAHMAIMGTGAWSKPECINYWLDRQGKVTEVDYYPYGKRKFLFPGLNEPEKPAAPPALVKVASSPVNQPQVSLQEEIKLAPTPSPEITNAAPLSISSPATEPEKASPIVARTNAPAVSTVLKGMREASRLEHAMSKEEVTRLLGFPERTEGFRVAGKNVVVWSYRLSDQTGRLVPTPLIFEHNRLTGWGDTQYQLLLRKARTQSP